MGETATQIVPIGSGGLPYPVRRALNLIGTELRSLIGQVESATIPRPDREETRVGEPGVMWDVGDDWNVQAVKPEDDGRLCVFVSTPGCWGGDVVALNLDDARHLALALLASIAWTERRALPPPPDLLETP